MRFRSILFDLYDTLVWLDVEESNAWRKRFSDRLGVPIEIFLRVWRRSIDDRMLGKMGSLSNQIAAAVSELDIEPADSLISDLVAIERQRLINSVKLYPSTISTLRRLASQGYKLGLLSNSSEGAAIPITYLGIDKLFQRMILSHEVGLLKPDPAIYKLACRALDTQPSETMFVADGSFGELDAARELGIFAVQIEQENQSKDYGSSSCCDVKIHDLCELMSILGIAS